MVSRTKKIGIRIYIFSLYFTVSYGLFCLFVFVGSGYAARLAFNLRAPCFTLAKECWVYIAMPNSLDYNLYLFNCLFSCILQIKNYSKLFSHDTQNTDLQA